MDPRDVGLAHTIATDTPSPLSRGDSATPAPRAETGGRAAPALAASTPAPYLAADGLPLPLVELVPGLTIGEYRLEGKLGEGGMGQVFAATHPVIGKRAAIKVIRLELCTHAEAVERFVQEARAVNQIGHPNIVDVFAFGSLADGRRYLVMEWLRGESLASRIKRERVSVEEVCEILDPVCRALEAAHEKRIIHRDLKPDNVFLVNVKGERPMVKLLDFGIAKLVGTEDTRLERTRTGSMLGTPTYISPEQARGRDVDERTDIYALGAMAFEMFTGRPPFMADNAMDMISSHLHDPPPAPCSVVPTLPAMLDTLVLSMLEKDAAKRPSLARVREGLAELRRAPATSRATVRAEPPAVGAPGAALAPPAAPALAITGTRRTETRRRGRGAVLAAAAVVLVGGGIALAVGLGGGNGRGHGDGSGSGSAAGGGDSSGSRASGGAVLGAITPPPAAPADAAVAIAAPPPVAPLAPAIVVVTISNVPDAEVSVAGQTVRAKRGEVRLELLATGDQELVVSAPGRRPFKTTITLVAGDTVTTKVRLERASGKPGGDKPPGDKPPGDKPPGDKPPGDKPPGDKPPNDKPPGNKPPGDDDTIW